MGNRIRIGLAPLVVPVGAFATAAATFAADRFACARPSAPESTTN